MSKGKRNAVVLVERGGDAFLTSDVFERTNESEGERERGRRGCYTLKKKRRRKEKKKKKNKINPPVPPAPLKKKKPFANDKSTKVRRHREYTGYIYRG